MGDGVPGVSQSADRSFESVEHVVEAKGEFIVLVAGAAHPRPRILEALEGPLNLAECPSGSGCCKKPEGCALQELWEQGSKALNDIYQGISLAALLERQQAKESEPSLNYSI